ncbi:MAG: FtsX-like permease family protein [Ginsengibacter sp.]
MIKNYCKVAYRNLLRNKRYTIINIGGLTLGFCCFLLLNFYVSSEKNFDKASKNVYRLLQKEQKDGKIREMATTGPRVGGAVKEKFPEVEMVTQLMGLGRLTVGNDPSNRQYEKMTIIDSSFFNVFSFKFLEGSPRTVFAQPNGIVITRTLAKKYFGSKSALHKTLHTNLFDGVIAGVVEDFPANTHLEADFMIPSQIAAATFKGWDEFIRTNWQRNAAVTYFKLKPQTKLVSLENKITNLVKENWPKGTAFQSNFILQPVQDIHLYKTEVQGEINKSKGNAFYITIFFWIAVVVLLVACFNYTGLLNVSFINRAKEIGVRKIIGAGRSQLLWQFFTESFLLTSIALLLAICILQVSRHTITNLLGASFDWTYLPVSKIIVLIACGLCVTLISVAYPTYIITRLSPVKALKENYKKSQTFPLQKVVLTFQFIAAITLITCTFLFYRQVKYMEYKDLGFQSDGVVVIDINSGTMRKKFEAIKAEFSRLPEVKSVSVTSRVPGEWKDYPIAGVLTQGQKASQAREMIFIGADKDFLTTYDVRLKFGTNFTGSAADSSKVLINQAAAAALGLKDPVGQWIDIPTVNFGGDNSPLDKPFHAQVSGVVGDFHFEDFHRQIKPMVIGGWNNPIQDIDYYSIKVSTASWQNTLSDLKKINDNFDAENPIEYHILNDQFQRFYENDILRSRLLMFFSSIIIFISCLGLFAITAYVLKHRTKEMGIRKVLGANIADLVKLITGDFMKLVLAGAVISIPLSWLIMSNWLREFAYRLPVQWFAFAYGGLITLFIAFITVGWQTVMTSVANPVKSLRTE